MESIDVNYSLFGVPTLLVSIFHTKNEAVFCYYFIYIYRFSE